MYYYRPLRFTFFFSRHPSELAKAATKISTAVKDKRQLLFVCLGLWFLQTDEAKSLLKDIAKKDKLADLFIFEVGEPRQYKPQGKTLKQEIGYFLTNSPPWTDFNEVDISEPAEIDQHWLHFFLTGDKGSIIKILNKMEIMKSEEELKALQPIPHVILSQGWLDIWQLGQLLSTQRFMNTF